MDDTSKLGVSAEDLWKRIPGIIIGYTRKGSPIFQIAGAEDDKGGGDGKPKDDDKGGGTDKDVDHWKAEAEKWKSLSRKHEDQAKSSKADLDKVKADADSSKSDQDKLLARVEAAEKRAEKAEINGLRYQVAADKKLTPAQATRLQGSTLDELEADADELIEAFKLTPDTGNGKDGGDGNENDGDSGKETKDRGGSAGGGKPRESLRSGADRSSEPDEGDPREIVAKIPRSNF